MKRVLLTSLSIGDPADVEIYAGAAIHDWMQKPQFKQIEKYGISEQNMFWTQGPMNSYSITIDVWAEADKETHLLLKLAGLCQQ
jgi:hypothetical protein